SITFRIGAPGRVDQKFVVFKLGHQSVNRSIMAHNFPSFLSAISSRTSEMEIIGRKRTNRNSSDKNKPMLPKSVAQSQKVGKYICQLEGRKSRCKLVTTMTKRSTHIPRFTDRAMKNRTTGLVRTPFDQSACGTTTLRKIKVQKIHAYGPRARFAIMERSNSSPLYQLMNASMK